MTTMKSSLICHLLGSKCTHSPEGHDIINNMGIILIRECCSKGCRKSPARYFVYWLINGI